MANEVLTYREIADRLGVSIPAAKMRAKRNALGVTRGNDGKARVTVPSDALSDSRPPSKKASGSSPKRDVAPGLKIMQDRLDDLRSQLNASNAALEQANAANAEATAERTRLLDDARRERESLHSAIERLTGQLEAAAKAQADALQKASNADAQRQGETMRLRSEIDAMRKRSLWERIRNR